MYSPRATTESACKQVIRFLSFGPPWGRLGLVFFLRSGEGGWLALGRSDSDDDEEEDEEDWWVCSS